MQEIVLKGQQVTAFDDVMRWHAEPGDKSYVLAGYAGTGKSTLAAQIAAEFGAFNVYYCAYTGKAANVLREKGCANVNTIHGWLYSQDEHSKEKLEALQQLLIDADLIGDFNESERIKNEIQLLQEARKQPAWALNEATELREAELVIVDEYSMLPDKIINDLLKVCKKVLFIGDPYQLPPVEGICSLEPNMFLEEIHRQAMDSAIIRYSKEVREGGYIPHGRHGDLDFLHKREIDKDFLLQADQLIVGKNATREAMNGWFRKQLGFNTLYPSAGEKMICLKNNNQLGLFNGMLGKSRTKARYSGLFYYLNFEDMEAVKVFTGDITGDGHKYDYRNEAHRVLERFTYGYAITCHKSQGSEFNNLAVINEPIGNTEGRRRWLYTSITRAKQHCTLINSK